MTAGQSELKHSLMGMICKEYYLLFLDVFNELHSSYINVSFHLALYHSVSVSPAVIL